MKNNNSNNDKDKLYSKLGVSSSKEDVHKAIKNVERGIFPGAFCKIVSDMHDRDDYCSVFHADGAGTKASLAYMYYKDTSDISVFKGIVKDAVAMNIDDILCVGATGPIFLSNAIGRNSKLISGEIISVLINEYSNFSKKLSSWGLKTIPCGGETADVGDLVKTLIVDATVFTSMKRSEVIDAEKINQDDVIIGLASFGKSNYEEEYNSGIGSNGLTLARHGTLSHTYYEKFPECYDNNLDEDLVFFGEYELTDNVKGLDLTIGEALLSPTRTYTPILLELLQFYRKEISGIIHNTGGGQTKVLNFGSGINYIKNDLFETPHIFKIIQESSNTSWREMYQVFNMGHRMEIYCNDSVCDDIIDKAKKYSVDAKIIGYCEKSSTKNENNLEIDSPYGVFKY
jgi:phosphoribosylformylglycinamidine cyclo-ligase